MRLEIGNRVRCTDGAYGELADIVIDPLKKRVTHLVIQPEHDDRRRQLVPIQLAKGRDDKQREIELECTLDEAKAFESVHEAAYLLLGERPAEDPDWDIGVEDCSRCRTTPIRATRVSKARIRHSTPPFPSTTTACRRARSRSGGRALSSLRTAIHSARWTASWSARTSTSRTSSSSGVTSGDGRRSPSRSGPSPG